MLLKQQKDLSFYEAQISYLQSFMKNPNNDILVSEMNIEDRLHAAKEHYSNVISEDYLKELVGTIGADPLYRN